MNRSNKYYFWFLLVVGWILTSDAFGQVLDHQVKTDSLLKILDTTKVDTIKLGVLFGLAWEFANTKPEKSEVYAQQALAFCDSILDQSDDDKFGTAANLNNMGEIYLAQGKWSMAVDYIQRSLTYSTDIGAMDYVRSAHEILSAAYEALEQYELAYEHHLLHINLKDSLFNEQKSKEIGKLEAKYEFEKEEEARKQSELEAARVEEERMSRRDNLQYSGILIFLVVLGIGLAALSRLTISARMIEGIIFFSFLLLFEFCLVLLDPYIEEYSSGAPALKLAFNAMLAAMIFPLHSFFETKLKDRMSNKTT